MPQRRVASLELRQERLGDLHGLLPVAQDAEQPGVPLDAELGPQSPKIGVLLQLAQDVGLGLLCVASRQQQRYPLRPDPVRVEPGRDQFLQHGLRLGEATLEHQQLLEHCAAWDATGESVP